jgi:hypothetical protein
MMQDSTPGYRQEPEVEAVLAEFLQHIESGEPAEAYLEMHPEAEPALHELLALMDCVARDLEPPATEAIDHARQQLHAGLRWRRLRDFMRIPFRRSGLWVITGSLGIGLSFGVAFAQEGGHVASPFTAVVQHLPPLVFNDARGPRAVDNQDSGRTATPTSSSDAVAAVPTRTTTPAVDTRAPTPDPSRMPPLADSGPEDSTDPMSSVSEAYDDLAPDSQTTDESPELTGTPSSFLFALMLSGVLQAPPPGSQTPTAPDVTSGLNAPATPSATPEPTSTPTPRTPTPVPTATSTPTQTPSPTPTPSPSPSPSPSPTATPDVIETPTPTPIPSDTPDTGEGCIDETPIPANPGGLVPNPTPDDNPAPPCDDQPPDESTPGTTPSPDPATGSQGEPGGEVGTGDEVTPEGTP